MGRVAGARGVEVDVWDERGIYVLYQDWNVAYVGKTGRNPLGRRIRDHLSDDLAGRWDRFAWYGVRRVNQDGSLAAVEVPQMRLDGFDTIDAGEALLIRVTAPPLNHRRERLPNAKLIIQDSGPAVPLAARMAKVEEHLAQLSAAVDDLSDRVGS